MREKGPNGKGGKRNLASCKKQGTKKKKALLKRLVRDLRLWEKEKKAKKKNTKIKMTAEKYSST